MDRLRIVLCDANEQELEGYAKICYTICEKSGIPVELKLYASVNALQFDMGDSGFLASAGIFIVDPANGFAAVPPAIRKGGYDGLILYLSNSESHEYYRQAFDVGAYNFVQKGITPEILARFQSVFESAVRAAQQVDRRYMAVSYAGEYRRIEVKDILYFAAAANHMVNVVYRGGSFKFLSTIQSLEERLGDRGFVRAHRSYLVSVNAIHRVDSDTLILNNGYRIALSRDRSTSLKSTMLCWQS